MLQISVSEMYHKCTQVFQETCSWCVFIICCSPHIFKKTSIQLSKLTGVSLINAIPLQHHINKRCGINILGQTIQDLLLLENMHWCGLSYINHVLHVYAIALSAKRTSKEKINQIQRYMHDYMCENKTYTNINYNCAEL